MPKKSISREEILKWVKAYEEEGKSILQIARDTKHDPRTIRSKIDKILQQRASVNARTEMIKDALRRHQTGLTACLSEIIAALEIPSDNIRIDKLSQEAPIQLSHALIKYNERAGLFLELQAERMREWELINEHLKRDRAFLTLKTWREALLQYFHTTIDLRNRIKLDLTGATGLKAVGSTAEKEELGYIVTSAIHEIFLPVILRQARCTKDLTMPEKSLVADEQGYIRHLRGGTIIAYAPENPETCKEAIIKVITKLRHDDSIKAIRESYDTLRQLTGKTKRKFEDIEMLSYIPGECRVCRRVTS